MNNAKFGINFDYKDEYYTTKLEIDKVDEETRKRAEVLHQEIQNDT